MPVRRHIETSVAGEEVEVSVLAKKHDDLLVLHPFASDVNSDLPGR
jgi:hypothetical protein